MTSNYRINRFLCHSLQNGDVVVQTANGVMKIHDKDLIDLIQSWDRTGKKEISESVLEQIFKEEKEEVIGFLASNGLIRTVKEKMLRIDSVTIMTNDDFLRSILMNTLVEDFQENLAITSLSVDDMQPCEENELSLVFLNPYNKSLGKRIRDRHMESSNSYLLMSYIYNNKFYMDSLYNRNWVNPCHCCHIGHIESHMRIGSADNLTYQQVIDMLYSLEEDIKIGVPLTNSQRVIIASCLIKRMRLLFHDFTYSKIHHEDINRAMVMKLDNFKIYEDTSIHWELCDCYE
ncbi:McbB family protein [Brevibacillus agri]|uniref:McbB family protein n=1 Tax=Brevibacillus sp. NSP2.1 TaxID=3003229 RepID=UPI0003F7CCF6|nr:McbB family protein [Brevibacillus sp. NSP2.1]QHZ54894.1 McbB family protein [Brevibacillus sp. NSP2.1]